MTEEKEKTSSPIAEKLKDNQKEIINRKEHFYDIMIEKLHLSAKIMDIFIILMIVLAVWIVVSHAK